MSWKPQSGKAPKRCNDGPVGSKPKPGRKPKPDTVVHRAKGRNSAQLGPTRKYARNAPCPCKSGKKFKKCHGAPLPPPPPPPPEPEGQSGTIGPEPPKPASVQPKPEEPTENGVTRLGRLARRNSTPGC